VARSQQALVESEMRLTRTRRIVDDARGAAGEEQSA
jgi:hypothetical protein